MMSLNQAPSDLFLYKFKSLKVIRRHLFWAVLMSDTQVLFCSTRGYFDLTPSLQLDVNPLVRVQWPQR